MELSKEAQEDFLKMLEDRFKANMHRHQDLSWDPIESRLRMQPEKMKTIYKMEETGGEPDVVVFDTAVAKIYFVDCSRESPKDRRSYCYDEAALKSRKKFKPKNSAMAVAKEIGVEMLDETQYRELQKLEEFDTKTSSWLKTPDAMRKLGGALFGDFRFGQVFVYHNGAESYYGSRGFRGLLEL